LLQKLIRNGTLMCGNVRECAGMYLAIYCGGVELFFATIVLS
jgi:hypothetical protein